MIITENCKEYFDKVVEFAKKTNKYDNLKENLDYLDTYAQRNGNKTQCILYKDFAPYSFEFQMQIKTNDKYEKWFNGGLIFHGSHDCGGDGGGPTFSVCLNPTDGWSIHT